MSRDLPFALDEKMLVPSRRPGYRVLLYDVRSTTDTIGSIVRGLTLDPLTGPLEATDVVEAVVVQETAGDFLTTGLAASRITVTIADPTPGSVESIWDPFSSNVSNTDLPARFLRRGNVVRIFEGDLDVDSTLWPLTFTGTIVGQAGVDRNRATGSSAITFSAVDRTGAYTNAIDTSEEFDRGRTYLSMASDLATKLMGLDIEEIDFLGWGTGTTNLPIQFVEQSPLVGIAQLMLGDGFLPRFDGEGKLTQTSGDVGQFPARFYENLETIRSIVLPYTDLEPTNSVRVVGISPTKTKVSQQRQPLAQVSVTTGYFTNDEEIFVYWSEDRTILAEEVSLNVQRSVNGGLSGLGGGEDVDLIAAQQSTTAFVGAKLSLATGYAPYVIVFLAVVYVVLAAIPDVVISFFGGTTLPVGRIAQAIALAAILILMTKIGRGQYEFLGTPIEYVFGELVGVAEVDGLTLETRNRAQVENHLLQSQATVDSTAARLLFRALARGLPRSIDGLHDLRLEPDDVFEIPDGRRFLIETIQRTLRRGQSEVLAQYGTFEVTSGVVA